MLNQYRRGRAYFYYTVCVCCVVSLGASLSLYSPPYLPPSLCVVVSEYVAAREEEVQREEERDMSLMSLT